MKTATTNPLVGVMQSGLWSSEEEGFFSWNGCDVCCHGLGGTVYDAQGYRNLEEAHAGEDNLYEFEVCGDCLNQYANG